MRFSKILGLWIALSLFSSGAFAREFECYQDLSAEKGLQGLDVPLLFLSIKTNTLAHANTSHRCRLGRTSGGWGEDKDIGTIDCNMNMDQIGAQRVRSLDDELDALINTDLPQHKGEGADAEVHYRADVIIRWDNYNNTGKTVKEPHIFDCTDVPVRRSLR